MGVIDADETPREWWIALINQQNVLPSNRCQYAYDAEQMEYMAKYDDDGELKKYVHVIEYPAYLRVKEERDALTARVAELEAALALKAKAHIK